MKVLIAESTRLIGDRLVELLSTYDELKIVGSVNDYKELIRVISRKKPDLIIMDIHKPDESGIEAIRKIKDGNQTLKIIIYTLYPYQKYRKLCIGAGADFFFNKPTDFNALIETVSNLNRHLFLSKDSFEDNSNQNRDG